MSDTLQPHGCSMPGFPVHTSSWSLLKLMSIELVMPSNHLIICHLLLLLPLVFPSIRVFSDESDLHIRWPKYWSFSISLSNEYLGLISFRIDWLGLLAVQGTLKSLLQHHSSKTSILQCSAFFNGPTLTSIHDYWKNHSFDIFENLSIITSKYEWMNGHKFIIYSMSSYGDNGSVLVYFVIFVCFII